MTLPTTASMGWAAHLGTVTESTYGTTPGGGVTEGFVFVSESLHKQGVITERKGLRGTRSHVADDSRRAPIACLARWCSSPRRPT